MWLVLHSANDGITWACLELFSGQTACDFAAGNY